MVGLGIVSEHTAPGCHWVVAGVNCALLGQFLHTLVVDSLLVHLGIVSEHTVFGCHWLVAGVDCVLLGQFLDSLLGLGTIIT